MLLAPIIGPRFMVLLLRLVLEIIGDLLMVLAPII